MHRYSRFSGKFIGASFPCYYSKHMSEKTEGITVKGAEKIRLKCEKKINIHIYKSEKLGYNGTVLEKEKYLFPEKTKEEQYQ